MMNAGSPGGRGGDHAIASPSLNGPVLLRSDGCRSAGIIPINALPTLTSENAISEW